MNKKKEVTRDSPIHIPLTAEEKAKIKKNADEMGLTMTAYARLVLLKRRD